MRGFWFGVLTGALVAPLVAGCVFLLGWSPVEATADPPRWETALAQRSFAAAVAREAPKAQNPIAPTSENLREGMKIFRDTCAGCHGEAGKPSAWGTSGYYPRVPQFDAAPSTKPDWQLFWIAKHGVRYTGMGAMGELMPDDRIWKVVTFVSRIHSLPPDVEAEWRGQKPTT